MAKGEFLGEFEQLVLIALLRLGDEAYGMAVRREIEARAGRDVSIGAVYATLDRLESKGLVRSRLGEAIGREAAAHGPVGGHSSAAKQTGAPRALSRAAPAAR